ncbi:MAG: DUF2291 family protein [Bacteroidales bacterium]|nr:DUF2291 family protein [Bacteroidales bacterium]
MKIVKWIALALLALLALRLSFYTENLSEKNRREAMSRYNPEELVVAMMRDSLSALEQRALPLAQWQDMLQKDPQTLASTHARRLGIGSPLFYMIRAELSEVCLVDDEYLRAFAEGVEIRIPITYIFGNTARDASGWFNIDDFRNTMDFNAVSAAMNDYIAEKMADFRLPEQASLRVLGAVAIPEDAVRLERLELIPFVLEP